MTRILFKLTIFPSCERALKNGRVKSEILRESSLKLTFGQGSCLISDFAGPNSDKNVLLQIPLKFDIEIFNPFHATGLFTYSLKTSENLWFSSDFTGYKKKRDMV